LSAVKATGNHLKQYISVPRYVKPCKKSKLHGCVLLDKAGTLVIRLLANATLLKSLRD